MFRCISIKWDFPSICGSAVWRRCDTSCDSSSIQYRIYWVRLPWLVWRYSHFWHWCHSSCGIICADLFM